MSQQDLNQCDSTSSHGCFGLPWFRLSLHVDGFCLAYQLSRGQLIIHCFLCCLWLWGWPGRPWWSLHNKQPNPLCSLRKVKSLLQVSCFSWALLRWKQTVTRKTYTNKPKWVQKEPRELRSPHQGHQNLPNKDLRRKVTKHPLFWKLSETINLRTQKSTVKGIS